MRALAIGVAVLAVGCSDTGTGEHRLPRPTVLEVAIVESGQVRFEPSRLEGGRLVRLEEPLGRRTVHNRAGAEPDRQSIAWEEIYLHEEDGSERRLTRDRRADLAPQLLRDGRVAFVSCDFREGGTPACRLDSIDPASGDRQTLLANLGTVFDGELSPDETRFLFTRLDRSGASAGLFVRDMATRGEYRLADGAAGSWSPDGNSVAFTSDRDENGRCLFHDCVGFASELYVIDAGGGFERRMTINSQVDRAPEWSGDGQWILFARIADEDDDWDLFAMPPDGACERRLTDTPATWEVAVEWYGSGHAGLSC